MVDVQLWQWYKYEKKMLPLTLLYLLSVIIRDRKRGEGVQGGREKEGGGGGGVELAKVNARGLKVSVHWIYVCRLQQMQEQADRDHQEEMDLYTMTNEDLQAQIEAMRFELTAKRVSSLQDLLHSLTVASDHGKNR